MEKSKTYRIGVENVKKWLDRAPKNFLKLTI